MLSLQEWIDVGFEKGIVNLSLSQSDMLFCDLFFEWLDYKKTITDSSNTILRHKQHFNKYFSGSLLYDKEIYYITDLLLESECNRIVRDFSLSRKEWGNVKTVLNGMFSYAVKNRYLSNNPMTGLEISVRYRQVSRGTGATQTFNSDERRDLFSYLDFMYSSTHDTVFLAVKLNFFLGLRVGELVALKWSDWLDFTQFHIVREEVRNQVTGEYSVVEHTKTYMDRFVILVPKAVSILQKIPRADEYIFIRDGTRITSRQVSYVLEKYAERKKRAVKSTHKMRKTYASCLNAEGVPLDTIREQLGHSDLTTTLGYIYNPLTESETYNLIAKAL